MDIPFVGFQKKNASVINTPTFTECRNMAKKKKIILSDTLYRITGSNI